MAHSLKRSFLVVGLGLGSPLLLGTVSCESTDGGLELPHAGSAGTGSAGKAHGGSSGAPQAQAGNDEGGAGGQGDAQAGAGGSATGGTHATGGSGGSGGKGGSSTSHGGSGGKGGSTSTGGSSSLAGGPDMTDAGGGGEAGSAGAPDQSGEGGAGGTPDIEEEKVCIFHSAPALTSGGEGGGAPAPNGVAIATNAFVGPYLTDLAGLALYIYGADVPGDCDVPPVSNCIDDCTQSWPIFDAGERTLASTLDDAVFGTIDRGNGVFQTTYFGWPLYRYKSDTTSNTINGQGKGKTWYAAEVSLPNLMIMRGPVAGGGIKYLSDIRGRTLYALSADTLGGSGTNPVSACTGTCLDAFRPFAPGEVYPVTGLEPHDLALFFRADGTLQTSYKGAPLYLAKGDLHAGQQNGLTLFGGALVLP
jgi:predicted lipoprotein with Yx(FWY)xxD motif